MTSASAVDTTKYSMEDIFTTTVGNWKLILSTVVVLLPFLNFAIISLRTELTLRSSKDGRTPPQLPYFIPFMGSLVEIMRDSTKFMLKIT
jgi:hypothetical protein